MLRLCLVGLKRYQQARDLHFVTFSCYRRQPLLGSAHAKRWLEQALEQARWAYGFYVTGYVIMPEHVHLLVSQPAERPLSTAIQAVKLGFARRVIGKRRRQHPSDLIESGSQRIWQARYYDFNVCTANKRVEKLRYIHRNPVKRGLVEASELWRGSSFRAYAYQEKGPVAINQWSVPKLETIEPTSFPM